ncbi:hypothetical protein [Cyanobium usitatum]|nr:hypothetical protein [Cyanobium usitatum]MCP9780684.1 hypothetical protein [Cyanobium sp. To12R1]
MNLSAIQLSQLLAVEQVQQSLESAALVRSDGKSASIKSISECIQSSNASSFSRISLAGSRRQLSIRKIKRHFESDEPDAPLLLERELTVEEVDVVIGRKQSNQANDSANKGFQQAFILAGAGQLLLQGGMSLAQEGAAVLAERTQQLRRGSSPGLPAAPPSEKPPALHAFVPGHSRLAPLPPSRSTSRRPASQQRCKCSRPQPRLDQKLPTHLNQRMTRRISSVLQYLPLGRCSRDATRNQCGPLRNTLNCMLAAWIG